MLTAHMAAGVAPANSYEVFLDPKVEVVRTSESGGQRVRYRTEPETGFRRRCCRSTRNSEAGRVNTLVSLSCARGQCNARRRSSGFILGVSPTG